MPKDSLKQAHRGIGFVTYTSPDPVDVVLAMPHSLHGVELAVDMATAKEGRVRTPALAPTRRVRGTSIRVLQSTRFLEPRLRDR